jgi:hypothetical protein
MHKMRRADRCEGGGGSARNLRQSRERAALVCPPHAASSQLLVRLLATIHPKLAPSPPAVFYLQKLIG